MSRSLAAVVLLVLVAGLAGIGFADEPPGGDEPVRLKKKKKPRIEEKPEQKPEPKKENKEEKKEEKKADRPEKEKTPRDTEPADDDADEREVLDRIARNLKKVEDRLANRELSDATRQAQDDVLKDIDSLIKRASQPSDSQQQAGGESDDSSQSQDQGKGGQTDKSKSGGKSSGQRSGKRQSRISGGKQSTRGGRSNQQRSSGGEKSGKPGAGAKKPSSQAKGGSGKSGDSSSDRGRGEEGKANKAADVYKEIWGHLPESLRSEMNAYFNDKQFMAKYDDLIKRYYSAIAEKGRPRNR